MGIWDRYSELYPDADLVYTIGVSDYTKDWFYAQAPRSDFCIIDYLYNLAKDYHASLLHLLLLDFLSYTLYTMY